MLRITNIDHKPTRLPPVYGYHTHPLLPLRQALEPILSRINGLDEYIQIAKSSCHFPSEHGLTREESASIYIYTMDWGEQSLYRVLNKALRLPDRSVLVPWHGYLKLFDTALKKLPTCRQSLWRGINVNISKNYKEGEEFIWWHFSSCSSTVKAVKQFLGPVSTLFMIDAKNGKMISAYSSFPQENEVILGLGTRLRIVSDPLDHLSMNIVHLVEISDENEGELSSTFGSVSIQQPIQTPASISVTRPVQTPASISVTRPVQTPASISALQTIQASANKPISKQSSAFKVQTYEDGSRYEGESNDKKKNGKGTYSYSNGNKYVGDWVNDKMEGEGVFTWPNGDRYEGQFKDDNFNGKGTLYFANGNKYVGDWIEDQRTGQGVFTCPDGSRYEGQFEVGKRSGKGTCQFASGNKYTGDWADDKMEGEGVYTWSDGDRYEM